ncbi:DUF3127 domain-containing protein [Fodinibius salsisoli]|uniref:DUF3127 domain-containing protein n=1 Tax=Fodinibius salsisoli TaxID=2820877 RepID=A0ABT3PTB9_9BACT|nr:DUF3127 domain-containing protein [Fodinibius salsisoli]MCW9709091.1 DUF3127 domain-containing protein [Fodinibius salsisoli]
MDLQIKGTVKQILEEQSGEGKNGPWRKRDFILETAGQYPKKICITQWGDSIDQANVQEGEDIIAHIDIQSREYKGNWYTDVKAWKVERGDSNPGGAPQDNVPFNDEEPSIDLSATDDDIPF